jgi:predicted transcriptional regulator of viral defense system
MIRRGKNTRSLDDRILKAIRVQEIRPVFSGRDLLNLGSRAAVDQVLSRLARKGVIRRLRRGLYDVPRQNPVLGTLSPDPIVVAQAAAASGSSRLQASGAYAANLLGLSEQVPGRIVFLTDGTTRRLTIDRQVIELRRAAPRNLIGAGTTAGTAFQALRYLGRKGVTAKEVGILRRTLSAADRSALRDLLPQAPGWMHRALTQIAE